MAVTFDDLDDGGDGLTSKDEFYEAAEEVNIHASLDADNDGLIDEAEFVSAGIGGNWNAWDVDNDGYLTKDQFYARCWDYYDADDDDYWTEDEWNEARDNPWWDVF